jgi:hypothetical protein
MLCLGNSSCNSAAGSLEDNLLKSIAHLQLSLAAPVVGLVVARVLRMLHRCKTVGGCQICLWFCVTS